MEAHHQPAAVTVIAAEQTGRVDLGELFRYRDLLAVLAYRDYRVRYAQTFLGLAWAFVQPAMTLLILTLLFGRGARVATHGVPYPLFAMCGLASWSYFAYVLSQSGTSIVGAQEMVKKIYFPRLIIPLSKAGVGFVDFCIAMLMVVALMIVYRRVPPPTMVFLPFFILVGIVAALAVGIWMSALTIRYRDFQHVVPFLVQLGSDDDSIAYPASLVTDAVPRWAAVAYYVNPMAGVVEGFRWALLERHLLRRSPTSRLRWPWCSSSPASCTSIASSARWRTSSTAGEVALAVQQLSKRYHIGSTAHATLREQLDRAVGTKLRLRRSGR